MTEIAETLPAPKGLFAHIQENNLRSLALFVWFAILLQCLYVATSVILISMGSPFETYGNILTGETNGPIYTNLNSGLPGENPIAQELGISIPQHVGEIWNQFWERDALLGSIAGIIFLLALVYVGIGLWFQSRYARRQMMAVRVRRQDEPRLYGLIEPMAISRGLPMPKLEVIESPGCNAYAGGMTPADSVIGVTRGLLDTLNDAELEAVLAHEFAHIENRDNRLMTIANLCAGVITRNSHKTAAYIKNYPLQTAVGLGAALYIGAWYGVLIGYGLIVLAYFMAHAVKYLISQKREFIADARAIEIVKQPGALMSALHKISRNDKIEGLNPKYQMMMISNLSGVDQWTHPSIADRIAAISATTGVQFADALAEKPRQNRDRWAGQREHFPAPRSQLGRRGQIHNPISKQRIKEADEAPSPTFGRRGRRIQRAPSNLRTYAFEDTTYGAEEQWTAQELRSKAVLDNVDGTMEQLARHKSAASQGIDALWGKLWMLPFAMVALAFVSALPTWLLVSSISGFGYFAWQKWGH